ncbi:MAG: hypothetical protein J7L96_10305 [Bacteroidales bacterium]|nr:hypothetical protein [Bacteroidales bacterium]
MSEKTFTLEINKNTRGYTYSAKVKGDDMGKLKEQLTELLEFAEKVTNNLSGLQEAKKVLG